MPNPVGGPAVDPSTSAQVAQVGGPAWHVYAAPTGSVGGPAYEPAGSTVTLTPGGPAWRPEPAGGGAVAPPPDPGMRVFGFLGAPEDFTVPDGVTSITVIARGGDSATRAVTLGTNASAPATVRATLAVTPGTTYKVRVGGRGATLTGGYNGGGNGIGNGGGGGGATDLRTSGDTLADRILVAGGGGGTGTGGVGEDVGRGHAGQVGSAGMAIPTWSIGAAGGGTASAGGAAGTGPTANGNAGTLGNGGAGSASGGGGGGGGYYGGGGGGAGASGRIGGGGGGSSYVTPSATGVTYTTGTDATVNKGDNADGYLIVFWGTWITEPTPLQYTGGVQNYSHSGTTLHFAVFGGTSQGGTAPSGAGAAVIGTRAMATQTVKVRAGGGATGGTGGYNGGGNWGGNGGQVAGAGASDLRTSGDALGDRFVVAGGGGGGHNGTAATAGGNGGYSTGGAGVSNLGHPAQGGTQSAGGTYTGPYGGTNGSSGSGGGGWGGGGGGGYYGGACAGSSGGGGGSSYYAPDCTILKASTSAQTVRDKTTGVVRHGFVVLGSS